MHSLLQGEQLFCGCIQGFFALAEGETDLFRAISWIVVKAGAGNSRDSDFFHQMSSESDVVGKSEGTDVGHDVIGTARTEAAESGLGQCGDEAVTARAISEGQGFVVGGREAKRGGA